VELCYIIQKNKKIKKKGKSTTLPNSLYSIDGVGKKAKRSLFRNTETNLTINFQPRFYIFGVSIISLYLLYTLNYSLLLKCPFESSFSLLFSSFDGFSFYCSSPSCLVGIVQQMRTCRDQSIEVAWRRFKIVIVRIEVFSLWIK